MNFVINVYFAKFLTCPRYLDYIKEVLSTEIKDPMLIDVRFYANRSHWFDLEDAKPEEALDFIKLKVAKLSVGLKPEVRQDFIDDYMFIGKC